MTFAASIVSRCRLSAAVLAFVVAGTTASAQVAAPVVREPAQKSLSTLAPEKPASLVSKQLATMGGRTYVPLADLAKALGGAVACTANKRRCDITSGPGGVLKVNADALAAFAADRQADAAVRTLRGRLAVAGKTAGKVADSAFAPPPRVDAIENPRASYSPGMRVVIRGSGFRVFSGPYGDRLPKAWIRGMRSTGASRLSQLTVVYDDTSGTSSTTELLIAKLPDELGGLTDQTVQLYVETYPSGADPKKSNEVAITFEAKREVKLAEHVGTHYCASSKMGCGRTEQDDPGNMQICRTLQTYEGNFASDGYRNARDLALYETQGHAIATLHENRCLHVGEAAGFDVYEVPLFNTHVIQGVSSVSGPAGSSSAAPVLSMGPNKGVVYVWFLSHAYVYYGVDIAIVGPAGVPYDKPW